MELLIPTPSFSISEVHGSFFLGLECVNGTAKDIYTGKVFSKTKIECDKEVIKLSEVFRKAIIQKSFCTIGTY